MAVALILFFAAADPVQVEAVDYRLPLQEDAPRIVKDCRRSAGDEILVCGRRDDRNRLQELTPPAGAEAKGSGVVGMDLPFGRVEPKMETILRSDGWVDKRIMITLKIPF